MRIAIVSTPFVSVPPVGYGGTELFCAMLGEELVEAGHSVTLFATGDSRFSGDLRFWYTRANWPPTPRAELTHLRWALHEISRAPQPYDAVQINSAVGLRLAAELGVPVVYTLHHERDDALSRIYAAHPEAWYVAISRRQLELETPLPLASVIHHGLTPDLYPASNHQDGYVLHLGRFAPEKGTHLAIDAAIAARSRIVVAGRSHNEKRLGHSYYAREVAPRFAHPLVEFVGEAGPSKKLELLQRARALLCPILWEEPFGLIAIEAMFTGTPVIGFRRGSFPEIIDEGVTGFLVDDLWEMRDRIDNLAQFDRHACAAHARKRFSAALMAARYAAVFAERARQRLVAASRGKPEPSASLAAGL